MSKNTIKNYFNIVKNFNEVKKSIDLKFYGYVGDYEEISVENLENELNQYEKLDEINIKIHSGGGSVIEGIAIYNILKNTGATINVEVIGIAASMASIIAMAGDTITMHENAYMMIHNPYVMTVGDAKELETQSKLLENMTENAIKIYQKHSPLSTDEIKELMDAETWMDGNQALEKGFCTAVIDSVELPKEASEAMQKMFDDEKIPLDIAAVFNPEKVKEIENEIEVKIDIENKEIKVELSADVLAKIDEAYQDGVFAGIEQQKLADENLENIIALTETIDAKDIEINALKSEKEKLKNSILDFESRLSKLGSGMQEPTTEIEQTYKPNFKNIW